MEITCLGTIYVTIPHAARPTGKGCIHKFAFVTTGQGAGIREHLCGRPVVHRGGVGDEGRCEGRGRGEVDVRRNFNGST